MDHATLTATLIDFAYLAFLPVILALAVWIIGSNWRHLSKPDSKLGPDAFDEYLLRTSGVIMSQVKSPGAKRFAVNGTCCVWTDEVISYEQVLEISKKSHEEAQSFVYFTCGPGKPVVGTLSKGEFIRLRNNLIFEVL